MAHSVINTCPMCGGDASLAYYTNAENEVYSTYVKCDNCGVRTKAFTRDISYDAEEEAIQSWNARV